MKTKKNNESKKYVEELLKKYNLYDFKDKYPSELSGGMRQRAALIRTLAIKPKILLLDEAFSALDYQTRLNVSNDVYHILKEEGITAIMVTHDIAEAASISSRVIVMTKRPTHIKNVYDMKYEVENMEPLDKRKSPLFNLYYEKLWSDIDESK